MMARDIPNGKIQLRCFEQELTLKRYAKQTLKNKIREYEYSIRYYKLALKRFKLWQSQGKGSTAYCIQYYQEMMFYVRHHLQEAKRQDHVARRRSQNYKTRRRRDTFQHTRTACCEPTLAAYCTS